jgi:hypothetical protein
MPTTSVQLRGNEVDSRGFPRQGKRLGDRVVFTDDIISVNGAPPTGAGQHSGFCVLVREPDLWLCEAGFILPGIPGTPFANGGQIQARGLMDFAGGAFQAAITGGIGDYHQARGQIAGTTNPPQTDWTLTIETP